MLKKILYLPIKSAFNLLFLALFCVVTPVTQAATVYSIKSNNEPIQLENNLANTFTDLSQDLMPPDTGDAIPLSSPNTNTVTFVSYENPNSSADYNLKSFHKKLMTEYGNNILVQESFNTLYELKQLWGEADASVTDFSYDVIFTLKIDQLIENDLYNLQKPRSDKNDHINNDFYDKVQRAQKSPSNNNLQLNNNFLTSLLRKETLYYLAALLILLPLLQKITNFLMRLFP